jgi:hypothetical protein
VLAAPTAVFLELQPVRIVLLVLDRRVVPTFAVGALEGDDRLHTCPFAFVALEGKLSLSSKK